MSIVDFREIIIPAIKKFVAAPIIEADQTEDRPDEPHVTYKVTLPYSKDVGGPDVQTIQYADRIELQQSEQHKATVSINTFAFDDPDKGIFDLSVNLAQQIYDWFTFYGVELLDQYDIVIVELTDVTNRDAIIVEDYERRHGFDVIMRMNRKMVKVVDYFDRAGGIRN